MNGVLQDLRYAGRQIRKSPEFAFTALLSLTLGIGATTGIFSVVYGVLLNPYPYRDPERMVHVELRDKSDRGPLLFVNGLEYQELLRASSIDDVFLENQRQETLTGREFPISVREGQYSSNLFTYMGVPPAQGREFAPADPRDFRRDRKVAIVTLNEEVLGHFSGTLVLLFVAVIALLVIGCANVSILLLARGIARQHELAVRASIGASRVRLVRQLLTESVLLSFAGAGLGVLAAYRGVSTLSSMLPLYSFPHEAAIRVNGTVLAFTAAVAVITGILFG